MNISHISAFRAFRSLNYTLYFTGRSVSQFGTAMQQTAVVWVVYSITHSAFMLGVTIFAEQFPAFLFSAFGGIAADRYNRYTIIRITQITSMIQAVLLAVLIITGHYVVWEILTLSVMLGIINAFDVPARQAMLHEVVHSPADLPSAISLTSAMASLAKLLGPALSGIILENFGAGVCFLLNAASFGAVMLSLAFMKLPPYAAPAPTNKKVVHELVEGFVYLKQMPAIGIIILVLAAECLLVIPYSTLVPVFAKVIFKGNAATFGYITSCIGAGAVGGTILLASFKKNTDHRRQLMISMVFLGAGLVAFSHAGNFALAMLFAAVCGLGTASQATISNIIIQSESAPHMRGRAIGVMLMAMFGMVPLGSLIIGFVSERIGAPNAILCEGIAGLLIAAVFFNFLKKNKHNNEVIIEHPKKI